jgi:hypothetical protein
MAVQSKALADLTLVLLACATLASCSKDQRRAVEAVRRSAKNPESVEVGLLAQGKELRRGRALCGQWTTATGYGGMDAWRGFILRPNEQTALNVPLRVEQDPANVRRLAAQLCPDYNFP